MLTVAKLAARVGLSADAVRYYERAGLIAPPERSRAGYRQFDEHVLERLRFIKGAQRTGLKLRQIRELLEVIDRGMCPCGHTEAMVDERIAEIEQEMNQLREVRTQLLELKKHLPTSASAGDAQSWPCQRTFLEVGTTKGASTPHGKATG